ncbi:alpha/beta hydrolase [Labrys wisconsinensis]|uniref:Acetyl esterase/lipase n=1 Tax=Labrys wisconsinensis TaxID=425677 RepID=A0ABU0JDK5_9HYPH|nr:alpha/beta hydrolase [Labrys wisconsinensis]MDQ0472361.1 acetyl esterase/lipase [Labrys wisconsinensis]
MPSIDPAVFSPAAVAPETEALNRSIVAKLEAAPDQWAFPADEIREARRQGKGAFPLAPKSPRAVTETIAGPGGPLALRILAPPAPSGVYLHIHGGGWMLGQADFQDPMLERLGEACGLACVSVDYRLAPEHPYPAGPEDCEAAALWLVREGKARFGTERFFIGGESAGANLSAVTMLRLRDRHGLVPFRGANLIAGCYDLAMTPGARRWGRRRLILDTRDIALFVKAYLAHRENPSDPGISPLHADLAGLPPALFSVGTRDPLLDDSLFMAARWEAAGNRADLKVWPGGVHVFQGFDFPLAHQAFAAETAFLNGL